MQAVQSNNSHVAGKPRYEQNISPKESCQAKSSLVKCNISEKRVFRFYPYCISYSYIKPENKSTLHYYSKRGIVSSFTKKSRFHLFCELAKISFSSNISPLFLSLTYHFNHSTLLYSCKNDLHNFLTQLRYYDPDVQYIWRIELQKRKVPHFHLIVFPGPSLSGLYKTRYYQFIFDKWHSIADPSSKAHLFYGTKIVDINNYRKACSYLSKYIAKETISNEGSEFGRHWGTSNNLPTTLLAEIEVNETTARAITAKLREWLFKNGRIKQENLTFFNEHRDQFVFIEADEADKILDNVLTRFT